MKVAPSILSADFGNMAKAVCDLQVWNADFVHCDVMDGVYVPNLTFGMPMVKALSGVSKLPMDVHLMIVNPEKYVAEFCDDGADIVTFHPDASQDVQGAIDIIKAKGKKCGLCINADKEFDIVKDYLSQIDLLLIMTVQAGFGGQSFMQNCLQKVSKAVELRKINGYNFVIEVDGGVNTQNAVLCKNAGADIVVAGSAVFGAQNPKDVIDSIKNV